MTYSSKPSFHRRFNILIARQTAEEHFVNRASNFISLEYPYLEDSREDALQRRARGPLLLAVANSLGERFAAKKTFGGYVQNDFLRCLQALEALYHALGQYDASLFAKQLELIISQSEADLGIRWRNGQFLPAGAKLLDDYLVNAVLDWLLAPSCKNVLAPFQEGLSEFLQGHRDPKKLVDAVRDMYEALEAMAKLITGRPKKDLSANRQLFVSKLGLSDYYEKMLKDYVDYACRFRHALEAGSTRTAPRIHEVEAFVYITGLFLRLALESTVQSDQPCT